MIWKHPVSSWVLAGFLAAGLASNVVLVSMVSKIETRTEALQQSMSTTSTWVSGGITRTHTTTSPAGTSPAAHRAAHAAEMAELLQEFPRDA